jgi:hypothetical protein
MTLYAMGNDLKAILDMEQDERRELLEMKKQRINFEKKITTAITQEVESGVFLK